MAYIECLGGLGGGSADAGFTPVGTVISVMGKTAPVNYLICDGTVYNIANYPELANYFLQQFEAKNYFGGDGTTTFAVPDLRGEFLRGTGTNGHTNQGNGANVGVHQDATEVPNLAALADPNQPNINFLGIPGNQNRNIKAINKDSAEIKSFTGNRYVNNQSGKVTLSDNFDYYTTRPTNTSVLYCIATKNITMGGGSSSVNYSTDEQVTGTWIDGKPIYKRTFHFTTCNSDNTEHIISLDSTCPVDKIISLEGTFEYTNNSGILHYIPLNTRVDSSTSSANIMTLVRIKNQDETAFGLYLQQKVVNAAWANKNAYITILYTKSTDVI